ncbi:MurR/RpiR family transcriptional regulator [Muricomes intestini]|jgi:DNA-binding MurR/RpiR family transcriptional regulator|uniref:MurR/RpiR family transcriptional regulator n=1 Tax=Muricomes intestini TaxID=1796634 RepID=UPI002FE19886
MNDKEDRITMSHSINTEDEYTVLENIRRNYDNFYSAEKKVADFILNNPSQMLETNVSETAELSGVSDATVVRFCKRIGYTGFYQMKLQLSHDLGKDWTIQKENGVLQPDSAQERLISIANIIMTIAKHIDTELLKKCASAIDKSETVFVIGNGYAKIMAYDLIYRLTRMGIRCSGGGYSETDFENLYLGKENDVAIFISRSGEDKKTYKEMQLALKKDMVTIVITDAVKCPMAQLADFSLTTGIEDRARFFINEKSSCLNMMALVEVLLEYVAQRHGDKSYLDEVIAEDRL